MNYYLGVELNGNLLKIAAFKKTGQSFEILKLDSLNLPNDAGEASKEIKSWANRNLSEPGPIKVVLTISESNLYIKEMEFPKMPPEKLNEAVYWEIPSIAPIPQSDAVYDWKIISEQKGNSNVLVIVGKNSYIQNIISIFRNAQMDVVVIEPSSYAFARVANAPFDSNTLVCLVQEQGMDFIILKYGIPFFTTSTTGHTQSEKMSNIKSGTDLTADIVAEGKKIINYWENKENLKINQVVIAGDLVYKYFGLSASLNIFPPITTYVGTIKRISSLKTNEYNDLILVSHLISIGAGVRHLQKDVFEGINLFPQEEKQKTEKIRMQKKVTSQLMSFIYTNAVVLLLLITSIIALNLWNYSLESKLTKLSSTLSTKSANVLIQEVNQINTVIEDVISLTKHQENYGAKLRIISDLTPQTVKLTSVSLSNTVSQDWIIEGVGDRNSILAFHKIISQNAKATTVSMPYSNFNKPEENEFSIFITW
jgi:hypothetical protein